MWQNNYTEAQEDFLIGPQKIRWIGFYDCES